MNQTGWRNTSYAYIYTLSMMYYYTPHAAHKTSDNPHNSQLRFRQDIVEILSLPPSVY